MRTSLLLSNNTKRVATFSRERLSQMRKLSARLYSNTNKRKPASPA